MTDDDTAIGHLKYWSGDWKIDSLPIHLSDLDEPYRSRLRSWESANDLISTLEDEIRGANELDESRVALDAARVERIADLEARLAKAEAALEAADNFICDTCALEPRYPAIGGDDCDCAPYRQAREAMK